MKTGERAKRIERCAGKVFSPDASLEQSLERVTSLRILQAGLNGKLEQVRTGWNIQRCAVRSLFSRICRNFCPSELSSGS
eukprot:CAMPEP_0170571802 /NCGR_PEP_ID=MMETSP0224-20130122/1878_1 /TAXON_ID=285029 /ORGANISM="Togula jolla, Strain CCCM 725" /LENGTH=79 /DNA_ID=CAMNT_0010894251 /DNA_START=570 /DNA_END=809 /DNA_ORIENTATION=+